MLWLKRHPDLATNVVTKRQGMARPTVSRAYRMNYPSLDLYSSAGVPVYYGDSTQLNVKVVDALPQVLPDPDLDPKYKVRPSLSEALSMIPAIAKSDWATPAGIDYTLFVVFHEPTVDSLIKQSKEIQKSGIEPVGVPGAKPVNAQDFALSARAAGQPLREAVDRLKTRLNGSKIRVIEVHLI